MIKKTLRAGTVLLAGLVVLTAGAAIAAEPDSIIQYRKDVMEAVGGHASAMGLIAQGKVPYDQAFAAHASMLATTAGLAREAFRENTDGKGKERTKAKADIWSKWPEFDKQLQNLEAQAGAIAALASAGDMAGARAKMPDLFKGCKTCHDGYRSK